MKEFELTTSSIPSELCYNLMENYEYVWISSNTPGLYRVVFFTIAEIVKHYKSKDNHRVGFILKGDKGEFKFGAVLNYHAPDEEDDGDDKGNYTLEFTLDEKDMQDLDILTDNHSDIFVSSATRYAVEIINGRFKAMEYCNNLFIECIDTLVKFLDANAIEGEEVSVVYRGVFTATVTVEGAEKVISIVPGEMIKQFIKGDSSL